MSITYLEAIREAQAKLLRDDDRVFIYGQDVGGAFGGAFKATKGLAKEFPERVLNTPISEDAIVGRAFSQSTSSPEKLGEQTDAFEAELRDKLRELSPDGNFIEIAEMVALVARREGSISQEKREVVFRPAVRPKDD